MQEGKTPKATTSASESNSFPIGELTFNIRAANPSKKSNTKEAHINQAADDRLFPKACTIPAQPESRLHSVSRLGM